MIYWTKHYLPDKAIENRLIKLASIEAYLLIKSSISRECLRIL
jgi:hypothetical protein